MISVFDLDHTLFAGNMSLSFFLHLLKRRKYPLRSFVPVIIHFFRYRYFGATIEGLHDLMFDKYVKGRPRGEFAREAELFVEQNLHNSLYQPAFERLREAQHCGHYTLILSSSADFLVKPIAERLGVHSWASTEYDTDHEGNFSGISSLMVGTEKAFFLALVREELQIQKKHVTAYSDSIEDLAFLQEAGIAVVVNPDPMLLKIARENEWERI